MGRCAWDGGEPGPRKHSLWVTPGEALTTRQGRLSTGEAQTTPERGGGETKFDPHWVLSFRLPLAKIMRLTVFFSKPFALPGTHSRASHRSRASEKSHQRVSAFFLLFFPALAGYSQQRGRVPPPHITDQSLQRFEISIEMIHAVMACFALGLARLLTGLAWSASTFIKPPFRC